MKTFNITVEITIEADSYSETEELYIKLVEKIMFDKHFELFCVRDQAIIKIEENDTRK